MKRLLVVDFPEVLEEDLLDQLFSDYPHVRLVTPNDIAELVDEVPWTWSSDELDGESPVRVTLRKVQQGVQVILPQWADVDGVPAVPCWLDVVPYAQDAFAPIQFNFYRPNEDLVAAKALVYSDGDVELIGRSDMGIIQEPEFGPRMTEHGIGGKDYVLFLEPTDKGD